MLLVVLFFTQVQYNSQFMMGIGFGIGLVQTWQLSIPLLILCYLMRNYFFDFTAALAFAAMMIVQLYSANMLQKLGIEYDWITAMIGTFLAVTVSAALSQLVLQFASRFLDTKNSRGSN